MMGRTNTSEQDSANILHFDEGIPGFENVKAYRLFREDDLDMIWSLRAADASVPSFVVIDPYKIDPDYHPVLSKADLRYFEVEDMTQLFFLVVAVIKPAMSDCVANLRAPIVIHTSTKKGKQIVMDECGYPVRYPLFPDAQ